MEYKPYLYQKKAQKFILERNISMLMFGNGMGDTVVALTVINELLYERFATDKVLIITSAHSAKGKWKNELEKWDHLYRLKAVFIRGSDAEKKRILKGDFSLYFITHESLNWLIREEGFPFSYVIADDFFLYRNPDTARFKRFMKIRKGLSFLLALSSFEALDHPEDLWGQIFLLDDGKRLENIRSGFYDRYFFTKKYNENGYARIIREPKEGALIRIREKISDICFTDDPALTIAELSNRYCDVYVRMEPAEYARYRLLEKGVLSLNEHCEEIENGGRTVRKMQAANGLICDKNKNLHILHNHKIDEIRHILRKAVNERVLIVYWFRHEKEMIRSLIPCLEVLETYEDIYKWRQGKIRAALVSAAAENAVYVKRIETDILVWFSLPWATSAYERLNNSVIQANKTVIYHLLTRNTIDEELIRNIRKAQKTWAILKGGREDGKPVFDRDYS